MTSPYLRFERQTDRQTDRDRDRQTDKQTDRQLRSCEKIEVAILGSPLLIVRSISMDGKQRERERESFTYLFLHVNVVSRHFARGRKAGDKLKSAFKDQSKIFAQALQRAVWLLNNYCKAQYRASLKTKQTKKQLFYF